MKLLIGGERFGLGANVYTRDGLEAFQETKHVHIESDLAPKDWRYPYSGAPPHG